MSKLCSQCKTTNSASARFCAHCGAPLTAVTPVNCPACGAKSPPGGKFCDACGAALPALGTTNPPIPPVPETQEISESLEGRPWPGPGIDSVKRRTPPITKLIGAAKQWIAEESGHLVGEARNVDMRQEFTRSLESYTIWSFRLVRYDAAGNRLDPIAVELRGLGITGSIAEGDRVEVMGKPPKDAPLQVKTVNNLSTKSRVSARIPISHRIGQIGKVIKWVIFLAVIIFIIAIISGGGR